MAKIGGKNKLPISSSDLKKAIVERNNSLDKKNKILTGAIKDREKELKSLGQTYNAETKKLASLSKDVQFQEDRFQKLKGGIFSNEKLLADKLKKVDKAEKELCDYESVVEKLEDKEEKLLDEIAKLEFYKSKCSESKNELAGFQVEKDSALAELDKIEDEIAKAVDEAAEKISYYEDQYDALEEKAKKHEELVYQFEQRLIETQDMFKDEENKLNDFLAKSEKEQDKAGQELQAIQNLCNNTEDEYVKWEIKIKKAKEKVDKEEERYQKKIERGKNWDISFLEQVAKKKLKSKVDNIDKAGLRDVLDG